MVTVNNESGRDDEALGPVGRVVRSLANRVRAWGRLAVYFAIAYGLWMLFAYGADQYTTSDAASAFAAVMFWFGLLFAVVTLLMGIAIILLNIVNEARR